MCRRSRTELLRSCVIGVTFFRDFQSLHIGLVLTLPPWLSHSRKLGLAAMTATGLAFLMLVTKYISMPRNQILFMSRNGPLIQCKVTSLTAVSRPREKSLEPTLFQCFTRPCKCWDKSSRGKIALLASPGATAEPTFHWQLKDSG